MVVTSSTSSCNQSGRCGSMNCGSTATMNTMPLGLVTLVKKPMTKRSRADGTAARADATSFGTGAAPTCERHCFKPSQVR